MDKLGENEPDPEVIRTYRLRTNDDDYTCLWLCTCFNWTENSDTIQKLWVDKWGLDVDPEDYIREQTQNGFWIWTVEWNEEEEPEASTELIASQPEGFTANDQLNSHSE